MGTFSNENLIFFCFFTSSLHDTGKSATENAKFWKWWFPEWNLFTMQLFENDIFPYRHWNWNIWKRRSDNNKFWCLFGIELLLRNVSTLEDIVTKRDITTTVFLWTSKKFWKRSCADAKRLIPFHRHETESFWKRIRIYGAWNAWLIAVVGIMKDKPWA